ncbi:hypothetical protein Q8G28_03915 [Lysinibacillus capsici]|uniref:hypothetical protein n=1 Tax=Lysinibacillus capsici TaxID=2115968 RepID=UPI00272F6CD1|nr:hypothetical protein [Lysinibacillus capsici]MDP1391996.1 hypothetical protein [Lysinibacillus capsici]MDP1412472.1 hypothetical protein [Lysinibacillus capsici]MDP1428896.1 hypothetical protein [Lysinibacillus capsici]
MSEKLKRCKACDETFTWNEDVILVNDDVYHKDCVSLYPTGYVAYIDDEFLGETENEDGSSAYDILDEGEYEEETA